MKRQPALSHAGGLLLPLPCQQLLLPSESPSAQYLSSSLVNDTPGVGTPLLVVLLLIASPRPPGALSASRTVSVVSSAKSVVVVLIVRVKAPVSVRLMTCSAP